MSYDELFLINDQSKMIHESNFIFKSIFSNKQCSGVGYSLTSSSSYKFYLAFSLSKGGEIIPILTRRD